MLQKSQLADGECVAPACWYVWPTCRPESQSLPVVTLPLAASTCVSACAQPRPMCRAARKLTLLLVLPAGTEAPQGAYSYQFKLGSAGTK